MKPPLVVRPLTDPERAGLSSLNAFTLRRCQILLVSADGLRPAQIAERFGCASQSVRDAIRAFAAEGLDCACQRLLALLHRRPRDFSKPSSLWTLALAAEVAFAEGITARRSATRRSARQSSVWASAGSEPRLGSPALTRRTCEKKWCATG